MGVGNVKKCNFIESQTWKTFFIAKLGVEWGSIMRNFSRKIFSHLLKKIVAISVMLDKRLKVKDKIKSYCVIIILE